MIGSLRSRVNPAGHAILQYQPGAIGGARRMRMNIEEAGDDQFAARVERVGCVACDVGLDSGDAASRDCHIAYRIETDGWVDHASALDDQVVLRRESSRHAGEHHGAGGCS
ncbi:MAG: hypothetical protein ACREDY_16385 [Bradyrhizobium sp.]